MVQRTIPFHNDRIGLLRILFVVQLIGSDVVASWVATPRRRQRIHRTVRFETVSPPSAMGRVDAVSTLESPTSDLWFAQTVSDASTDAFRASWSNQTNGAASPRWTRRPSRTTLGPDPTTKPDYDNLVGPLGRFMDNVFANVFRDKLAEQVLGDVILDDVTNQTAYDRWKDTNALQFTTPFHHPLAAFLLEPANFTDIVALAAALTARFATNPHEVQRRAQNVLEGLFPKWLPRHYARLFARPFPAFSARMNAYVTAVAGVWLMGECTVNDVTGGSDEKSTRGPSQGVLVTRCRFLEESACASVCVNACKIPTQSFFLQRMGLALTMEPNYDTGSCQFSFGRTPDSVTEATAWATPCLARCPTAGSYRLNHVGSGGSDHRASDSDEIDSNCFMMSNP